MAFWDDVKNALDPGHNLRRGIDDIKRGDVGSGVGNIMVDPGGFFDEDTRRTLGTIGAPLETGLGGFWRKKDKYRPGSDDELQALRGELAKDAKNFRRGMKNYTGSQFGGLLSDYQENLKTGTRKVNEGYANRGLLYSGLRANKEGELKSGLAGQLASGAMAISRDAENLARAKERAASSLSLDLAMQNQARAEQLYDTQMQNQLARRQQMSQFAQGVGYGAGYLAGGRSQGGGTYGATEPSYYWSGNNRVMNMPNSPSSTGSYSGSSGVGYSSPNMMGKLTKQGLLGPDPRVMNHYGIKRMTV